MEVQECLPVGCVPPACCPYLPACTASGGVPGPGGCTWSRGVYLVPLECTWSRGVYLVPGGCSWSGVCTWSPRGCTWSQGGVPGPGGCTWSQGNTWSQGVFLPRYSPHEQNSWHMLLKQECIPVGCVLPTAAATGVVSPPGTPPDQAPPRTRCYPLWTEWQTGVNILPCPKLRFWAVNITLPQISFVGGNKKAFQQDAYHLLANRTCFGSGYQMSVLMGEQVWNKFEQVFSDGHRKLLAVGTAAKGGIQGPGGSWSHAWKEAGGMAWAAGLYSEVQWTMRNGHMGLPPPPVDRMTETYENITFTTPLASGKNEWSQKEVCWNVNFIIINQ